MRTDTCHYHHRLFTRISASIRRVFTYATLLVSLFVCGAIFSSQAMAAEPLVVKDITPGSAGTVFTQNSLQIGALAYFTADDGVNGTELWRSDGTDAGTFMVKDIYQGAAASSPVWLTELEGLLYFAANDGIHGVELWRSDGTEDGTYIVRDINPGSSTSGASKLTVSGKILFFSAYTQESGYELWKSDGTEAGTVQVKDIYSGVSSSGISELIPVDNVVYFKANSGAGYQLWTSNGAGTGTHSVWVAGVSDPLYLTNVNGIVFFRATDAGGDTELWRTGEQGEDEIVLVSNINSAASSNPTSLTHVNGSLFYTADDGSHGIELWTTFGFHGEDTLLVDDIIPGSSGSNPSHLTATDRVLFFRANVPTDGGVELWVSEGPEEGVERISDSNPGSGSSYPESITAVGSTVFFKAYNPTSGTELWQTNGSLAGTFLHDINPGSGSSYPSTLIDVNGTLFLAADNGTDGMELMKLTGTAPVISCISDQEEFINTSIGPLSFTVSDTDTPAANLLVTAVSNNQSLLPDANITILSVSENEYTINLTPEAYFSGTAIVTITVTDGTHSSTELFRVKWWHGISIGTDAAAVDYGTIQEAVDAAVDGDVIFLAPGTYSGTGNESINFSGKAITIKSIAGPEQTVIDLKNKSRAFVFDTNESNASTVDGITIFRGDSSSDGGAISIIDSSPTIINCVIRSCSANGNGGAIYISGASGAVIENTSFFNNRSAVDGGGIYLQSSTLVRIRQCEFRNNIARENGGAVYGTNFYMYITASHFYENVAWNRGGGVYAGCAHTILNSVFVGNSAYYEGGAFYISALAASGLLEHLSVYGNESQYAGAAFVVQGATTLKNSIIWANESLNLSGNQISNGNSLEIIHSDIQGGIEAIDGVAGISTSGINISEDPVFVLYSDLHLDSSSPCIDAGIDSSVSSDVDGRERPVDGNGDGTAAPDMGAYEFSPAPTAAFSPKRIEFTIIKGTGVPGSQQITILNSGSGLLSWEAVVRQGENSWLRLEPVTGQSSGEENILSLYVDAENLDSLGGGNYYASVDLVDAGDNSVVLGSISVSLSISNVVRVGVGQTYSTIQDGIDAAADGDVVLVGDGTYQERSINFNGKAITVRSENGPQMTIVDGQKAGTVFIFDSFEMHDSILQGFTITNGIADDGYGGGVTLGLTSSPEILSCIFFDNKAANMGGALSGVSNVVLRNCEFVENSAPNGGAIWLSGDSNLIDNCVFDGNTATAGDGGAIHIIGKNLNVTGGVFRDNSAMSGSGEGHGGAIFTDEWAQSFRVSHARFSGNESNSEGGAVYIDSSEATVSNCIFLQNNSGGLGGGGLTVSVLAGGIGTQVINSTFVDNNEVSGSPYGGVYAVDIFDLPVHTAIVNCLFWQDSGTSLGGANYSVSHTATSDTKPSGIGNVHLNNHPFVDKSNGDFRLSPSHVTGDDIITSLIDAGTDITWLFSDYRGSYRAIDGDKDGMAAFDIGAMEYSEYYGGIDGDLPTKAFANLRMNSSVVAVNYGYSIEWDNRDPFPLGDRRIQQADEYTINLALVNDDGMRYELGTQTVAVSQLGYSVPYTFSSQHIGSWRLRLEMASDPNQYVLSDPISIEYKQLDKYYWGSRITPPVGADPDVKPDFNDEPAVFWSAETSRLYAVGGPKTLVVTWYEDSERTRPVPVVVNITYPDNPKIFVAESMPVSLMPAGSSFEMVELKFSDSDATVSANEFSANTPGWAVLLFHDNDGETADEKEIFEVVRILPWNNTDNLYPFDPTYPLEEHLPIGTKAENDKHDPDCGAGYVFFADAFYDGFGANRAYDRATRTGSVFAVNRDLTGPIADENSDPLDDLVVVWYDKSSRTGVCWPSLPVRYDPQWPELSGADVIYLDATLTDLHDQGTGPLDPVEYGLFENMVIYNQPDRAQPGFNPNEEHAAFFTAPGSTYPGIFPLRTDINRTDFNAPQRYTSDPYVLLKFVNPGTGKWDMKAFQVVATDGIEPTFRYENTAGNELNAPFPLNQMVYGPCSESNTTTPEWVLEDKDSKIFSFEGDRVAGVKYFYKLQAGFYYDLDNDGIQDVADGTCIAWLDGYESSPFDDDPIVAEYDVSWPDPIPTLHFGETLVTAKMQPGELVGLPEIGAQCKVDILFQSASGDMVRLLNPLKEMGVDYVLGNPEAELPQLLKPKYDLGTGRWLFTALPYHIQSRLTYDAVASQLKLRGKYESGVGEPTLLLNTFSDRELKAITDIAGADPFGSSRLTTLNDLAGTYNSGISSSLMDADIKALSAGDAHSSGYVTLAFNNDEECAAPTMLSVIQVDCPLYTGELKVIESANPFEEKVTMRHNGDFGGSSDSKYFQWQYMLTTDVTGIPAGDDPNWKPFTSFSPAPDPVIPIIVGSEGNFFSGVVDTVIQGSGAQLLSDKWFRVRYYDSNIGAACPSSISSWTAPQLYEGWIKRVMKKINLFDQKITDYHSSDVNSLASMISQAGQPYGGDIALSDDPNYLQQLGIVEVYETLLNRGNSLAEGENDTSLNQARLFAANRLADLYMLLGNEAYADAADPTIGFSTESGQYGAEAASIFSFQNQVATLLEEELTLLRGRDEPGVRPFYNRLIWNFTLGDGEVAYKENYNITDQITVDSNDDTYADTTDGAVNEWDARVLFPQGHGDAWGHYLSAMKKYYGLLKSNNFTWQPQTESILVAGVPVSVDYMDERKFAAVAAARAKTGAELVNLTYRDSYTEDPEGQWQGYKDTDSTRAWGVDGWAKRAGQAAYFDWAVGNAMLPSEYKTGELTAIQDQTVFDLTAINLSYTPGDSSLEVKVNGQLVGSDSYAETSSSLVTFNAPGLTEGDVVQFRVVPGSGIEKVDRTTVVELLDIAGSYKAIQKEVDKANVGLNPLGLAQNSIPFDIDPGLVASGQTHFEQIYTRAVQAMNNSIAVFNHANDSTMRLRSQQDSLADFQRNIENMEADYNKRLVEVYGYPYGDDCGANKTYDTDYCQTGPDLYHYMYVEASELMGMETPAAHDFSVTMQGEYQVGADGSLNSTEKQVTFSVATDSRYGIMKPPEWLAPRKASGEIQFARSDLLQLRGRFEKSLIDYQNLLEEIDSQAELIVTQYGVNKEEISILNRAKNEKIDLNRAIHDTQNAINDFHSDAAMARLLSNAAAAAIPTMSGFFAGPTCVGVMADLFSVARGAVLTAGSWAADTKNAMAENAGLAMLSFQQEKEILGEETSIAITALHSSFAVEQQLKQLESQIRAEVSLRHELYVQVEGLQQSANRYLAVLAKGEQLMRDRLRFRKQTAAQIVDYRYKDMSFRIFRNDALEKYRAQFDMAGMYVYLAAKAYDYDTALLDYSSMAGQSFLTDIVKQRSIGLIQDGQPLTGSGLADPMKRMWQNFQVLKPQLGFNNPQIETNRFSLRQELFRVKMDIASNVTWRNVLRKYEVADLWDVPEFRRYCRPFASEGMAQPGLVIPFTTTVTPGLNFFKWPLGGGDSYYSSTNFATKVRSVGVWFTNYNTVGLTQTPRVYLVPVGEDVLRTPSGAFDDIRTWQVVDQKLPLPFPINTTELESNPDWIPSVDTVHDSMFEIRRHSDFRAYHDSGYLNESEMQYDTRLIGRSVWNSRWLLIIPGQSLLYDPEEGINTFIDGPEIVGGNGERTGSGIFDIKLFFETYGYSGN